MLQKILVNENYIKVIDNIYADSTWIIWLHKDIYKNK